MLKFRKRGPCRGFKRLLPVVKLQRVNARSSVSEMERSLYKPRDKRWLQGAASLPGAVFSALPPALLSAEWWFPSPILDLGKRSSFSLTTCTFRFTYSSSATARFTLGDWLQSSTDSISLAIPNSWVLRKDRSSDWRYRVVQMCVWASPALQQSGELWWLLHWGEGFTKVGTGMAIPAVELTFSISRSLCPLVPEDKNVILLS